MPANEATSTRAEESMIARVAAGDATDHSAFHAASRLSRTGEKLAERAIAAAWPEPGASVPSCF